MKIKKLTLVSYGKFRNRIIELKDGLNIFYGENGSGKSTVAAALKTFLYKNLKGNRKYKKNYIPLGDSKGIFDVEFETDDGVTYETGVTLGQTAAKSLSVTVKKPLGTNVLMGDAETGEYFLKTSEDMYDSVCFIREPSDFIKVTENEAVVSEELSGAVCSEKGSADILSALEKLENEINVLTRKTATGSIYPLKQELGQINSSIRRAEEIMTEEGRIKGECRKLSAVLGEKNEELKLLEKDKNIFEEYLEYEKYQRYLRRKKELEELCSAHLPEDEGLVEMTASDEKRMLGLEISINYKKPQKKGFPLWIVLFGMSAVAAVAGLFIKYIFYLSALFAGYGIVFMAKEAKKREEIVRADADRLEYENLCLRYGVKSYDDYISKRNDYIAKKSRSEAQREKIRVAEAMLKEDELKVRIFDREPPKPEAVCDYEKRMKHLADEIAEAEKTLAVLKERENNLFNNFPGYDTLLVKKEELEERLREYENELEVCRGALDVMEITASVYKESYLPGLVAVTEEILREAGVINAEKLVIDEGLNISVREGGSPYLKGEDNISSGISDSLHFALRLAVIKMAFEGKESPVVILDDPFMRLDDKNYEKWVCYLNEKCPFQTVFFTAKQRIFKIILEKDTINRL